MTADSSLLIVDDVDDIRTEMIQMFALADVVAIGASGIDEALIQLRLNETVRVALCDLRLRGENGLTLASRVGGDPSLSHRAIDFVFLTGDPSMAEQVDPQIGMVFMKPINPSHLIRTVEALIDKRRSG